MNWTSLSLAIFSALKSTLSYITIHLVFCLLVWFGLVIFSVTMVHPFLSFYVYLILFKVGFL